MKRIKTGGRKKKSDSGRWIHFVPNENVLSIWDSWKNKTTMIENAIVFYQKHISDASNNIQEY